MLLKIETCLSCAILGASSWVWAYAADGISRSAVLGALPGRLWPPPKHGVSPREGPRSLKRDPPLPPQSLLTHGNSETMRHQARVVPNI